MMLGSLISGSISTGSWFLGLALHLGLGAVFGRLYQRVMELLRRSGWRIGLILGLCHAVISGLLAPLVGRIHPLVRTGALTSPTVFGLDLGLREATLFVALHLMFGAFVGAGCFTRLPGKPGTASLPPDQEPARREAAPEARSR
jgi:hypothetical protein